MEFFFVVIVAGFLLCLSMSLFTTTQLPPFFDASFAKIASTCFKYFIAFDDFIFLYIILDKLDIRRGQEKKLYMFALIGMALVLLLFFFFYAKYPVTAFMHDNALSDIMVFSVEFNAIGRLDIIAMITIMMMTLFQMEIYSYGFCRSFEEVFPKLNRKYAIALLDLLFVLFYTLYLGNHENVVSAAGGWFSVFAIVLGAVIFVVGLLSIWIGGKNEKQD